MGFRRSGWEAIIPQGSPTVALAVGVLAALAGCSNGTSRTTLANDGGRAYADADSVRPDAQGSPDADSVRPDAQGSPDAQLSPEVAADTNRGPDAQLADTAGSRSEAGDGPPAEPSPDAGTDSARGPEAGADADPRKDTGPDGTDGGRDADAQTASDSGLPNADAGSGNNADPCAGGTTYADSTTAKVSVSDYGWVRLGVASSPIVEFDTTMIVPETPAASGTLFLWPGLQPLRGGANYAVLDNGVLQPVLTWGPTCAPNAPAQSYKSWWISGQYVNTYITSSSPNYASYNGCHGGPGMTVAVGDTLDMRFVLNGTDWTQTVTNQRTAQSVSYTVDMLGQAQASAEFVIEEYSAKLVSDVVFTSSVITFASSAKSACQPAQRGTNDYFSAPRVSADGLRCCIGKVILRAEGVAATTPNTP